MPVAWSATRRSPASPGELARCRQPLARYDGRTGRVHQARPPVRDVRTGEFRARRRDPRDAARPRTSRRMWSRSTVGRVRSSAWRWRRATCRRPRRGGPSTSRARAATRSRCGWRCPTGWGRSRRSSRRTEVPQAIARRNLRAARAGVDRPWVRLCVRELPRFVGIRSRLPREHLGTSRGTWRSTTSSRPRAWLIAQGIADAGRRAGDRLVLRGLSHAAGDRDDCPDLWAGGMAGVAIGDWSLMYRDGSDALKAYQVGLLGGLPEERPERLPSRHRRSALSDASRRRCSSSRAGTTRAAPRRRCAAYEAAAHAAGKDVDDRMVRQRACRLVGRRGVDQACRAMLSFASSDRSREVSA